VGIDIKLQDLGLEQRLPAEVATVVYRTVQEALTNVARHAQASKVTVRLERRESTVVAVIEDNGQGFEVDRLAGAHLREHRMGQLGMRERATLLGGTLDIQSNPGQGTRLILNVPLGRGRGS
jgi:signal transduction histidine kinase